MQLIWLFFLYLAAVPRPLDGPHWVASRVVPSAMLPVRRPRRKEFRS